MCTVFCRRKGQINSHRNSPAPCKAGRNRYRVHPTFPKASNRRFPVPCNLSPVPCSSRVKPNQTDTLFTRSRKRPIAISLFPVTCYLFPVLRTLLFACSVILAGCHRGSPQAGAIVYSRNCSGCHRAGTTQAFAPSLSGYLREGKHDESETRRIIRDGKGNMPPFSRRLSRHQVDDLLAYMRTL